MYLASSPLLNLVPYALVREIIVREDFRRSEAFEPLDQLREVISVRRGKVASGQNPRCP